GPPMPTVWPTVSFTDVDAGVRLLTEGLGFVVTALYRNDDGVVVHAEARWPDGGGVMFGSRGKPGAWGALQASQNLLNGAGRQAGRVGGPGAAGRVRGGCRGRDRRRGLEPDPDHDWRGGAAPVARHRLRIAPVRRP